MSKERITVLLTTNMTGTEKKQVLVIGKAKNPRCFKNVKSLPVIYESNKKAWMTSDIFTRFICKWDKELRHSKKKILLLVDNCPAHPNVEGLSAIKLCFLPPNTTSVLQPLDQGIIKSLKVHFRKFQVTKMIEAAELGTVFNTSLLDAITLVSRAWEKVTSATIANCFKHSGLLTASAQEPSQMDNLDYIFYEEDELPLSEWIKLASGINTIVTDEQWSEFVDVDNNLDTWGELDTTEIVDRVLSQEDVSADDEEISEEILFEPPSILEALQAAETLRNFIAYGNSIEDPKLSDSVSYIEKQLEQAYIHANFNKKVQSKITDFFK